MIWTAWNNGSYAKSGAGFGLKVPIPDRDAHMSRIHRRIIVILPTSDGESQVTFNIDKDSFWNSDCNEVISKEFGRWLIEQGLVPWLKGKPPRFEVQKLGERKYGIVRIVAR